ncbi:MAG TPA: hypothetical protein DEV73_02000 [Candidatus Zambryskibacteria bacterium]|nr:hypothetical protein [Candidatus Blackburnbacteria bacterium]HCH59370.1 hypothetical protein [Candidatus Zambryskibacteria bacterium]
MKYWIWRSKIKAQKLKTGQLFVLLVFVKVDQYFRTFTQKEIEDCPEMRAVVFEVTAFFRSLYVHIGTQRTL